MRRCASRCPATRVESFAGICSGFGLSSGCSGGLAILLRSRWWAFRAKFFGREFTILIAIQFTQRLWSGVELCCGESTILILIQGGNDGRWAMALWSLRGTGRAQFIDLYEQLLPDHAGGPLLSLSSGVDAVTRALTGRNASAAPGETSAWVQEINFYADKDKTETYGFRSEGFGVAGGVERGSDLGAVGISLAFTSSDLEDPESAAEEVLSANLLELGLYWRAQGQYWTTWARAAAC